MLKFFYPLVILLFLGCTKKTEIPQLKDSVIIQTPALLSDAKERTEISLKSENRIKSKPRKTIRKNGIDNLNARLVDIGKPVKQTKTPMNQVPGE